MVPWLAASGSASIDTPGGRFSVSSFKMPPKSARVALTRIACRLPLGTATTMLPVPKKIRSLAIDSVSLGAIGVTSIR